MAAHKANEPIFLFACAGADPKTFSVMDIRGVDEISSLYHFALTLQSSESNLKPEDLVNQQASIFMYRDEQYSPYSGIISEFSYYETTQDYSVYHCTLMPRLHGLEHTFQTRIFQKMTVPEILKEVFTKAELSDYYTLDLQENYPQREFIVQYQESDMNFIARLMEEAGIWYCFREPPVSAEATKSPGKEKLFISDKPASFEMIPGESEVLYRDISGLVETEGGEKTKEYLWRLRFQNRIIPRKVKVKNYNYRTPEIDLSTEKEVAKGLLGTVYRYGHEFKDTEEAMQHVKVLAERMASAKENVIGTSDCAGFRAGAKFTLKDHHRDECNDTYLIKSVTHHGAHVHFTGAPGKSNDYENEIIAIPSTLIPTFKPELTAKVPKIPGIMTAMIETQGSQYAGLDETGRYKVRLPFDLSDAQNSDASKFIRLAQPYSGRNYGMHFPSHEKTEMVIACIDGDPNKMMGIGTVPNAETISPVVSNNQTRNIIRTAGKNEILLEDLEGKQKITMKTAALNHAAFDDENKNITIRTTEKNHVLLDDKNEEVSILSKEHLISMKYKEGGEAVTIKTAQGHVITLDDTGQCLTIQTKGGHVITMDDKRKTITMSDGADTNTVCLDSSRGIQMESKGDIVIKATKNLTIEALNISAEATQAIDLKSYMNMSLAGLNINAKATMNAAIDANVNASVNGKVMSRLEGAATFVTGTATTTIAGGMLMLNP